MLFCPRNGGFVVPTVRVIGPGRAGGSLAYALAGAQWTVLASLGRGDEFADAAKDTDVLVIATPDDTIAGIAAQVEPVAGTLVVHLSGSLTLDVLDPHPRRASLHPLASLSDPRQGAALLAAECPVAVAGDAGVLGLAEALGAVPFAVDDEQRALYHATAVVAANHLVALMAQVERLAERCEVPAEAFWRMSAAVLDSVRQQGPAAALTGPAARGDVDTITRHLAALPAEEVSVYRTMAVAAASLAGRELEGI